MRFKNVQGKETYGSAYEQTMDKNIAASEKLFKDRPEERAAEIRKEAQAELLPKKNEVADGLAKLAEGQKEIDQAKDQLEQQQAMIGTESPQLAQAQTALENSKKSWTTTANNYFLHRKNS